MALGADLLLRREQIAKQFVDFPVETALGFGAFVAGGAIAKGLLSGLTSQKVLLASKRPFILERKLPLKEKPITPFSETFKVEVKFKIDENAIKTFAVQNLRKRGVNFNQLSDINKSF
ncbi:hypothetical protein LCGC14_2219500 [marine sediment metagenome]|uniref:Uncharacterized protein n=1 Tax=marine sediment metagenome TaxID=412755 RepID=A0A0F9G6Z0_9ZZZZ